MKRTQPLIMSPPIRANNGIDAFKLLNQNQQIEIYNEILYWFIEELMKNTDLSFCYHINKYSPNWTTFNKHEE